MTEQQWPTLVFTSRSLLKVAKKAANRAKTERDQTLVAILFSAATVEGFVNDIMELTQFMRSDNDEKVRTLGELLSEAEEQKAQTALKLQLISAVFRGTPLERGEKLYQDFNLLFKLRNSLVHLRPEYADSSLFGPRTRRKHKPTDELVARRIISAKSVNPTQNWIEQISVPEVAIWAYTTAGDIAKAIFEMIPPGSFFRQMVLHAWSYREENDSEVTRIGDKSFLTR